MRRRNGLANTIVLPKNDTMERFIQEWMERQRVKKERSEQAKQEYALSLMQGQPYERRAAIAQANNLGVTLPEYRETESEALARETASRTRQILGGYQPDQFEQSYLGMEQVLGRNPNATATNVLRDRSYLGEQFPQSVQIGAGLALNEDQRVSHAENDRKFNFVEFPESRSKITLQGAQTEQAHTGASENRAGTALRVEQTINERQERDPNSPLIAAKQATVGERAKPKSPGEKALVSDHQET